MRPQILTASGICGLLAAACSAPSSEATTQDNDSPVGTYEATLADGAIVTQTIRPDGTYQDVSNGEVIETGTWVVASGQICFDPEGDEGASCFFGGEPNADGRFEVMDADGELVLTARQLDHAPVDPGAGS